MWRRDVFGAAKWGIRIRSETGGSTGIGVEGTKRVRSKRKGKRRRKGRGREREREGRRRRRKRKMTRKIGKPGERKTRRKKARKMTGSRKWRQWLVK